jgi:hypothetical protein
VHDRIAYRRGPYVRHQLRAGRSDDGEHGRPSRSVSRILIAVSFAVCGLTYFNIRETSGLQNSTASTRWARSDQVCLFLGDMPLQFTRTPERFPFSVNKVKLQRWAKILSKPSENVREESPAQRSRMLHALRLAKTLEENESSYFHYDDRGVVTAVSLPMRSLQRSWRGVEVIERSNYERSEHRDQLLCALAELGVPLSSRLADSSESASVKELLQTSLAEFHLGQRELSWTAVAYAHYLPPQAKWTNRFGEEFDFDRLATELMEKAPSSESCYGVHLAGALNCILLADEQRIVLTPKVREAIRSHLRKCVADAVSLQEPDGSWPGGWLKKTTDKKALLEFSTKQTQSGEILIAGHLLELFQLLPNDLKPPPSTLKRGVLWLVRALEELPEDELAADFCPNTHAICAIALAMSSE